MNRWVVIVLGLMAAVVVGRHIHRFGGTSGDEVARPSLLDPLGVQVAHADLLPPLDTEVPAPESQDQVSDDPMFQDQVGDGGVLEGPGAAILVASNDVTEVAPEAVPSDEAPASPRRQRVPLNPEPPLPAQDRVRTARTTGPLTKLDPHQMLFEPGEKAEAKSAVRKTRVQPAQRVAAPTTQGPLTAVDPRQMLFEPGEPAPRTEPTSAPAAEPAPEAPAPEVALEPAPEESSEPTTDAQNKARIMKRLLRVMELAGEKP